MYPPLTRVDFRYLADLLTPRHAATVDDPGERNRLAGLVDSDTSECIAGFISQTGRVLGEAVESGETVLYESDITVDADGDWEPGTPSRVWMVTAGTRREDIFDDTARLFLAQSLHTGAASQFCGWRDRVVAIVPEEVGPKESKIIRTLAGGDIEVVHTRTPFLMRTAPTPDGSPTLPWSMEAVTRQLLPTHPDRPAWRDRS